MSRRLTTLAMLCLTIPLLSCETLTTLGQHDAVPSSSVQAIPCPTDPIIKYHAPTTGADVTAWINGSLADQSNQFDTPATVSEIRRHNAAVKSVCSTK